MKADRLKTKCLLKNFLSRSNQKYLPQKIDDPMAYLVIEKIEKQKTKNGYPVCWDRTTVSFGFCCIRFSFSKNHQKAKAYN